MKRNRTGLWIIALCVLSVNLFGCGSGGSDQPDLGLVTGTVFFEGEPLRGASISFIPDNGRPATAITDEQGNYELKYIRETPGCKIGHSKVVITSLVEGEDNIEAEGDDADRTNVSNAAVERVPSKYNTKTELEAEVKPGENQFDFRLTK